MTERTFLSLLTGSFATPAAENPTVAVMEAAYRHHGIDARYLNCEVAPKDLRHAVLGARAMGWAGFNCSIPHKVAVIDHLDQLAASASIIAAVNCVVIRDELMVGENTDGKGFVTALRTVQDPAGMRVTVLGAGGAARAIAVETALAGSAHVTVLARDRSRAQELAALVHDGTGVDAAGLGWAPGTRIPDGTDVLVNATSVGLHPDVDALVDVDLDSLDAGTLVADVIPNPPRTLFLREADERGCRTLDGLGMLVAQAAVNIELWTGVSADQSVMRRTLAEIFGG
ncbi:MAG: shikimate dehydrogenase [Actinomycetota bacterium]|nr:shikimate dehydrogenase [Actinomycetota bacterium]